MQKIVVISAFVLSLLLVIVGPLFGYGSAQSSRNDSSEQIKALIAKIDRSAEEPETRIRLTGELLQLAREQPDRELRFAALVVSAQAYGAIRQVDKVEELVDEAWKLLPQTNAKEYEARLMLYKAHVLLYRFEYAEAIKLARRGIAANVLDDNHVAMSYNTIGVCCSRLGLLAEAADAYENSAVYSRKIDSDYAWKSAINNMAFMLVRAREFGRAKELYEDLLPIDADGQLYAHVMIGLGEVELGTGNPTGGKKIALEALSKFPTEASHDPRVATLELLAARCLLANDNIEASREYCMNALEHFPESFNRRPEAELVLAQCDAKANDFKTGIERVRKVLASKPDRLIELQASQELAEMLSANNEFESAYRQTKVTQRIQNEIATQELTNRLRISEAKSKSQLELTRVALQAEKEMSSRVKAKLAATTAEKKAANDRRIRNAALGFSLASLLGFGIYIRSASRHRKTQNLLRQTKERADFEKHLSKKKRVEAIGELTSSVSHDFNNILQIILHSNQLIRNSMGDELTEEQSEILNATEEAVEVGSVITSQLLTFVKRKQDNPCVRSTEELIASCEFLFSTVGCDELLVVVNNEVPELAIKVDSSRFTNTILNLLLNSNDAAYEGNGNVHISVTSLEIDPTSEPQLDVLPGKYVRIDIADDGIGMTEEEQEKAFEPFYSTKQDSLGTGLGLASVRSFVRQSGGTTWISSEPGRGTTVSMIFPECSLNDSPKTTTAVDDKSTARLGKCLIVEDNPLVRNTLFRMLQCFGYECEQCETAEEARELMHLDRSFSVLLTDIRMPGKWDGIDLANWTRKQSPETRIIILSGNEGERDTEGFVFLQKPFKMAQLTAALNSFEENTERSLSPADTC